MKQREAVVQTIENLGGIATLGQINHNVFKIEKCERKTKTPFASIRRIVLQTPNEIYKIKPGLYGLVRYKKQNEEKGFLTPKSEIDSSQVIQETNHYYYQGLLVEIGNMEQFTTYVPAQDQNRHFSNQKLGDIVSIKQLYSFGYEELIRRAKAVDVIRFNDRRMPKHFYEIEHSTDFQNSLLKFVELQDFNAKFTIVADHRRKQGYETKLLQVAFKDIAPRVKFLDYKNLSDLHTKTYELFTIKTILGLDLSLQKYRSGSV